MTIPSGRGRNGDLSITIILLKSESTLHLSRSISPSINQDSKQTVFPKSQGDPLFDYQMRHWPPNVIGNKFGIGPQILLSKREVLAPFKFSVNTLRDRASQEGSEQLS